jgi:uncharacterized protein YdbL (DUF1318 family)
MKNITRPIINILVLLTLVVFIGTAFAQGIKERMKQRLPAIVDLKARGVVGENYSGYLAFVPGQKSSVSPVENESIEGENQDRKTIYSHIAKQQNTSLEVVEKRRALALSQRAIPGEFIQNSDGSWIQK